MSNNDFEARDSGLQAYFDALDRIKSGAPRVIPIGAKINNDSVSLEAGRKKGSIKKSRPSFTTLINEINDAAADAERTGVVVKNKINQVQQESNSLRQQIEEAIERELLLLVENAELKAKIRSLTGEKIIPLRGVVDQN